ncbi:MAG TPA: VWA domain-containing protein [Anaerolineaceae bacterium]
MAAHELIIRFMNTVRAAGVRVSVAEELDAMRVVEVIGYQDRGLLRDALGLTVAKSADEEALFEACFDEFFSRSAFQDKAPAEEAKPTGANPSATALGQMLLADDSASLAQAMERAANAVGISQIRIYPQVNLFARRILEQMGMSELESEIGAQRGMGTSQASQQADWLAARQAELQEEVRNFVRSQLQVYAKGEPDRIRDQFLRQMQFGAVRPQDKARLHIIIRQIARRLATRHARVVRKKRKGQLDVRRLIQKNASNDGVMFHTAFRSKKVDRPKIVAICDVSRSVADSAEFLLLFLWSLREVLGGVRAFAFSSDLIEVTGLLDQLDSEGAAKQILRTVGFESTNYGSSLATFRKNWFDILDHKTTVIILGDARGNRTEPRADIVREMAERSKRLIWLNPEGRTAWTTGDSQMLRYKNYCHLARECSSIDDLEHVVSALLEAERFG